MATFFGEVIEPRSRSFVTDGEECFLEQNYVITEECKEISESALSFEYLIIASGKILSDFSEAFLITNSSKVLQKYHITSVPKDNEVYSKEKITSYLYKLTTNTLLYVCERLPHVYFAHMLLDHLKPWIHSSSHLVVLTSESMSTFKPMGAMFPFVRSLHSNDCTLTVKAKELELPNTISGLPATIMSWCQAKKKSALVYAIYVESSHLDSFIAEPLLQLMKSSDFLNPLVSSNAAKLQSIVNSAQLLNSNLYL